MIGKKDIVEAVASALRQRWPERDIYQNLCPAEFLRPAFLLEIPRVSRRDANAALVEETAYLTVTCFQTIGADGRSDPEELSQLQTDVINLFRVGYLRVLDRSVKFLSEEGGMDIDRAWIDLQCTYFEQRGEEPVLPRMQQIHSKTTL